MRNTSEKISMHFIGMNWWGHLRDMFGSAKCMRSIMAIMSHRGGLRKCYPEFPYCVKPAEESGAGEKGGRECNKTLSTTRIIWKNNKATITHATHQLCVTVAAVEWKDSLCLCSASFPEKHFLHGVGKTDIVYTINQANVITVSCTFLSPKRKL